MGPRLDKGQIEVVDTRVAEILKRKTGEERLKMVWDAWDHFHCMAAARLRSTHPRWTEEQIEAEIARLVSHGTK
ncbi:MAG: hypothetical protein R3231_05685 [bacterium]|nr:hypothetical protein [bacterium]